MRVICVEYNLNFNQDLAKNWIRIVDVYATIYVEGDQ